MHNQIQKEFESGTLDASLLYQRLYPEYQLFATESELLKNIPNVIAQNQDFCLIASTEPDVHQIRNFVCLDTRSREVRNKTAGEASTINLVIR
jgi:hypothetical protein